MMNLEKDIIAKKYAQAFFNLFSKDVMKHETSLLTLKQRLDLSPQWYIPFFIATIKREKKKVALEKISHEFSLPHTFTSLFFLLFHHNRIHFLEKVLSLLLLLCDQHHNRILFTVSSSHDLSADEKDHITSFITSKIQCKPRIHYTRDTSLLCGFRIRSTTYLYEQSVSRRLRNLEHTLLQRDIV